MGVCEAQRLLRVEMSPPPLSSSSSSPPPPRWSPLLVTQITCRPGAIRRARRRRLSCPLLLASDGRRWCLSNLSSAGRRRRASAAERRRFSGSREAVLVSSLPALPVPRHSEYVSTPPGEGKYLPPRPRPVFARLQRSGLGPGRRVHWLPSARLDDLGVAWCAPIGGRTGCGGAPACRPTAPSRHANRAAT